MEHNVEDQILKSIAEVLLVNLKVTIIGERDNEVIYKLKSKPLNNSICQNNLNLVYVIVNKELVETTTFKYLDTKIESVLLKTLTTVAFLKKGIKLMFN